MDFRSVLITIVPLFRIVGYPTSPNGGQGYAWGVADDSTATPGTGPISGRGGSGQYLYAEASMIKVLHRLHRL